MIVSRLHSPRRSGAFAPGLRFIATCLMVVTAAPALAAGPQFTTEQADRGRDSYETRCMMCHGENLNDGDFGGAPLKGAWFADHWGKGDLSALFTYTKTLMPPDNPGGLNDTTYADIVSYLLLRNGYAPGSDEMPLDADAQQAMSLAK